MAHLSKTFFTRNVLFCKTFRPSINKVAIIGGGVAGLQTARALQRIGKTVTIFEKNDDFGGVWHGNYDGAALQTEHKLYQFPEYLVRQYGQANIYHFPILSELKKYTQAYANHFNLYLIARFNTTVMNISPVLKQNEGENEIVGWKITT